MNSGADVTANLELANTLMAEAATDGCRLVVLPENFALMPERGRDKAKHAEQPGDGPIQTFLADAARRHDQWIVAGSIPLASPEPERVYGACPVIDNQGQTKAIYRKIHLFDVDVSDEVRFQESDTVVPGTEPDRKSVV